MLKYKKREIIGKNIFELVDIWKIENEANNILDRLKEDDYKNVEIIYKARDGIRFIVELNTKRIYENGNLVGIQGVGRDITERKKMEQQLMQRNKELITINEISRNLNTTFNLYTLLNNVVENIVKLMDIPICTIRLLKDDNVLKLYARAGVLKENIIAEKIYVDESVYSKATMNSDINILYDSVYNHDVENTKKAMFLHRVRYASIIPLKARNEVLGVLVVATKKELSESDFNILTSVSNQTAMVLENIRLYQNLKESYMKTIETLAAAVEAKDKYTEGHSLRVSKYGYMLAKHLKLPKDICEDIKIAGILHDIGKIGISDSILTKPGRLTEEEYKAIIEHPMIGSKILESVGFSDTIMDAIKYHHKRYDLKGYPKDVDLDKLSISASIIGVADAFDAMTSTRAYREAMTVKEAVDELIRNKGRQFNPVVVDAFIDIYNNTPWKIEEILKEK
jgi:putative nucleotidyltransferase with HDIG domain